MSHYGKIGLKSLPSEAKAIWYSRHVAPEPCEPIDIYWPTATDPDLPLLQDYARRLVDATPLTEREQQVVELCVLDNCTMSEAAREIGITPVRARQILRRALIKFYRTSLCF
jgi:DNA-directed RNA polymerase specialized sigma24 family protein